MKKNIIIIASVILGLIVARFAFSAYGQFMSGKMRNAGGAPEVTVDEVQEASVIKQLEAPGRVLSEHRVDVVARIEGYLNKSYFKEGDYVKKGQVLFQIEPQEWLYDLQQAKANVQNTKAQLVYAEKQLKRSAILVKKDYISKSNYDEVLSTRDALRGQLAMYQAQVNNAQRNYGYTRVKAPVSGQVGMISVTVGNFVNQNAGVLTTIYSSNPIYVTFPIDSKEYEVLDEIDGDNENRKVDLFFANGDKYSISGVQNFHDNKVDETTGTITMRATFANPKGKLINGDYVKVIVYSNKTNNVPIVPQTAVMENAQGKYVYRLEGNIPKMNFITVSGQHKDNWIVESGLKKGDKIVTGGLQKVIPDVPVKVVNEVKSEK